MPRTRVIDLIALKGLCSSSCGKLTPGEWAHVGGHTRCIVAVSVALGCEVRAPPPSRMRWARSDSSKHRLRPRQRTLCIAELRKSSELCRKHPSLLELKKALHLFLANKPKGAGQYGHVHDAACLASDLPDLVAMRGEPLPVEISVHPGVRLGAQAPTEYRARVAALPTIDARLQSDAAPQCAAFAGDKEHNFYYGIVCLFFSLEFGGLLQELCLVRWLVVESAEFADAEDLQRPGVCCAHCAPSLVLHRSTSLRSPVQLVCAGRCRRQ